MAAKRILYVNYDPETLIRDERLLIQAGYEVGTVIGTDGVMACESAANYASIVIDETCPSEDRKKLICWLTDNFPNLRMLSAPYFNQHGNDKYLTLTMTSHHSGGISLSDNSILT